MKNEWNLYTSSFLSDHLNADLKSSPWAGHRNFAYDLICYIEPQCICELGTHYGCSFFSFCQAVLDHKLNSEIIAIDTWKGDPHAGYYGNDVYDLVNQTLQSYYSKLKIQIRRQTFNEALQEIKDNSINLLHIDGLHTYDAVCEDYTNWLPKLAQNGVILFHDTSLSSGYESAVFWQEIKVTHPYIEFDHSYGLGIFFPKGDSLYNRLLKEQLHKWKNYYEYKATAELNQLYVRDQAIMLEERWKVMRSMESMIQERDKAIHSMESMIQERDKAINSMESMIQERDREIHSMKSMVQE